jgi:hypothetical protein
MDFALQIVLAIIILIANLLGGKHSSLRYEYVTAIFGWGAGISLPASLLATVFFHLVQ